MSIDSIKHPETRYIPVVLLILDGWGISPNWGGNAITMNNPPTMNSLWRNYPHTILQAFKKVADQYGRVGSSEIGHASIGTGKIVQQDLTEITQAIENKKFFASPALLEMCEYVKKNNSTLHLIGLVSDGGIHSHINHLFALLKLAKNEGIGKVNIHVITDGRDVEKTSSLIYLNQLEKKISELGMGRITSLVGRFYAMDRDDNLDRTRVAYEAQVFGRGKLVKSAKEAIQDAYKLGFTDEFIPPYIIGENSKNIIRDGDAVMFFNFRPDRAKQLARFYADKSYLRKLFFWREYKLLKAYFVSLTSYKLDTAPINLVFPPLEMDTCLGKILSEHGNKQLHIAESEKYAHVTYFFNGGREAPFPGEDRVIIPSLKVKSYEDMPEMSAAAITQTIINAVKSKKYHFIVANFANVDMVGHTGNILATSKAIEFVDKQIKTILRAILSVKGALFITADHGNAEQMIHLNSLDTETRHTLNPVPFIYITPYNKKNLIQSAITPTKGNLDEILQSKNTLADVAPTILQLLGIAKPTGMSGKSLLNKLK